MFFFVFYPVAYFYPTKAIYINIARVHKYGDLEVYNAINEYFDPLQANRYKITRWVLKEVKKVIFLKCHNISVRLSCHIKVRIQILNDWLVQD